MVGRKFRNVLLAVLGSAVLAAGIPANAQFHSEGSDFLDAVKHRDGNTVTEMLRKPGTQVINARDVSTGETGLHIVTKQRNVTWIRFLSQEGANPNLADKNGITPLSLATRIGFVEGVEALIAAGAEVDVANDTGETPLIGAVHNRNLELMEILLAAGADIDRTDNSGRSARAYAQLNRNDPRVLAIVEQHDAKNSESDGAAAVYGPAF